MPVLQLRARDLSPKVLWCPKVIHSFQNIQNVCPASSGGMACTLASTQVWDSCWLKVQQGACNQWSTVRLKSGEKYIFGENARQVSRALRGVRLTPRTKKKSAPDTPSRLTRQSGYSNVQIRVAPTARGQEKYILYTTAGNALIACRRRRQPAAHHLLGGRPTACAPLLIACVRTVSHVA